MIKIYVKDENNFLDNVSVKLNNIIKETEKGYAAYTGIEKGTYPIEAFLENYQAYKSTINITDENMDFVIELQAEKDITDLYVKVISKEDTNPITGASVTISGQEKDTDANGEVEFTLKEGEYDIIVQHKDYSKYTDKIKVAGEEVDYEARLTTQEATGDLTVNVISKDAPIRQAIVTIDDTLKVTDDNGTAEFTKLSLGEHNITIKHNDYKDYSSTIKIIEGANTYKASIEEQIKKSALTVSVSDNSTKEPVSDASVTIGDLICKTNENGKAIFTDLAYGEYTVSISHPYYDGHNHKLIVRKKNQEYNTRLEPLTCELTVKVNVTDAIVTVDTDSKHTTDNTAVFRTKYGTHKITVEKKGYWKQEESFILSTPTSTKSYHLTEVTDKGDIKIHVQDKALNYSLADALIEIDDHALKTDTNGDCILTDQLYGEYTLHVSIDRYDDYESTIKLDAASINVVVDLEPEFHGRLELKIIDDVCEDPINRATVDIVGIGRVTTVKGRAIHTDVAYGIYTVRVYHDDYLDFEDTVKVNSDDQVYTLRLTPIPKGSLRVKVLDTYTQLPIEEATVKLGDVSKETSSDGRCTFTRLLYDTYTLTIDKPGYDTLTDKVTIQSKITDYTAELGISSDTLAIITVRDILTSRGISDAKITCNGHEYTTNYEGTCRFGLDSGKYEANITKEGYYPKACTINANKSTVTYTIRMVPKTAEHGKVSFQITDRATTLGLADAIITIDNQEKHTDAWGKTAFTFLGYGEYEYTVSHEDYKTETGKLRISRPDQTEEVSLAYDGERVSQITVNVQNKYAGGPVSDAIVKFAGRTETTNEDGTTTFSNVPYQKTTLSVSKSGYDSYTDTKIVNMDTIIYNINLPEIRDITVHGRVIDDAGPLSNVKVNNTYTDTDGEYTITDKTAAEKIQLTFSKLYYKDTTIIVPVNSEAPTVNMELNDYGLATLTNCLVHNKVYMEDHYEPSAGLSFTLEHVEAGAQYNIITDDSGLFSQDLEAGHYNLIIPEQPDYKAETITGAFYIRPETHREDLVLTCTKLAHDFKLKVIYDNMEAAADTKLSIQSDNKIIAEGTTDETGSFTFKAHHEPETILSATVVLLDGSTIDKEIGSSTLDSAKIKIPYTSEFTAILSSKGSPIEEATVEVGSEKQTTDSEGKANFKLPAGDYTIFTSKYGYIEYSTNFTIEYLKPLIFNIELNPLGTKSGKINVIVNDTDGNPVGGADIVLGKGYTEVTGNDGIASFEKMAYSTYAIAVIKDGVTKYIGSVTLDKEEVNIECIIN